MLLASLQLVLEAEVWRQQDPSIGFVGKTARAMGSVFAPVTGRLWMIRLNLVGALRDVAMTSGWD